MSRGGRHPPLCAFSPNFSKPNFDSPVGVAIAARPAAVVVGGGAEEEGQDGAFEEVGAGDRPLGEGAGCGGHLRER